MLELNWPAWLSSASCAAAWWTGSGRRRWPRCRTKTWWPENFARPWRAGKGSLSLRRVASGLPGCTTGSGVRWSCTGRNLRPQEPGWRSFSGRAWASGCWGWLPAGLGWGRSPEWRWECRGPVEGQTRRLASPSANGTDELTKNGNKNFCYLYELCYLCYFCNCCYNQKSIR